MSYGDACPVCHPGVPDAAQPHAVEPADGGKTLTTHTCMSCGTSWRTLWGRDGWPVDRLVVPVTPEQASRNASVLMEALGE